MDRFDLIRCLTTERDKGIFIWIFNIDTERYWHSSSYTIKNTNENIVVNGIEEINLLLTRKQDILILRNMPDSKFLNDLEKIGFDIPRIMCPKDQNNEKNISELLLDDVDLLNDLKFIASQKDVYFVPYGISNLEEKIADICKMKLVGASSLLNSNINNKIFARRFAEEAGLKTTEGMICYSIEDIEKNYNLLHKKFEKVVIKLPYGASGKGLYIIENRIKLNSVLLILKRFQKRYGKTACIIEGWYDEKIDLNYQIYVSEQGIIDTFSIKEQIVEGTVYKGSLIPPGIDKYTYQKYIEFGNIIGKSLFKTGFTGVLGIDSIVIKNSVIIPVLEINARFTLSTYSSFLNNLFPHKKILTYYVKLNNKDNINYDAVMKLLLQDDILFKKDIQQGIFIFNSATINNNGNKRLFTAIVADKWDEVMDYKRKFDFMMGM